MREEAPGWKTESTGEQPGRTRLALPSRGEVCGGWAWCRVHTPSLGNPPVLFGSSSTCLLLRRWLGVGLLHQLDALRDLCVAELVRTISPSTCVQVLSPRLPPLRSLPLPLSSLSISPSLLLTLYELGDEGVVLVVRALPLSFALTLPLSPSLLLTLYELGGAAAAARGGAALGHGPHALLVVAEGGGHGYLPQVSFCRDRFSLPVT
jgi:hypothetical protein